MPSKLNLIMGAGLLLCLMSSVGILIGALLLAYRWEWLHPAVATTVVILLGIGLAFVFSQLAWAVGNKIDPYRGGHD